jgi:hypothetical protein
VPSLRSKWAAGKAVRAGLAVGGRISESIRNRRATQPPTHFQRNPRDKQIKPESDCADNNGDTNRLHGRSKVLLQLGIYTGLHRQKGASSQGTKKKKKSHVRAFNRNYSGCAIGNCTIPLPPGYGRGRLPPQSYGATSFALCSVTAESCFAQVDQARTTWSRALGHSALGPGTLSNKPP